MFGRKKIKELKEELARAKSDADFWKEQHQVLADSLPDLETKTEECVKYLEEITKLKKENEIYKKYYNTNSEPSDEIRAAVFKDIKVMELKEENQKLMAIIAISTGMNLGINNMLPYGRGIECYRP